MKKKVLVIVGPTAVGKTKLSIELAKHFNGEIISGDSMQVYRGMDIGTAKVTEAEKVAIPHHMIDIKDPDEEFSVADFQNYVYTYIEKINKKNKLPIIVGGSGLYIQAILYNYNFQKPKRDDDFTKKLELTVKKEGIIPLYNRLKEVDPEQASKIHPNNHRRVIRALEVYETTGMTMSDYHQEQQKQSPYHFILIGLEMERSLLYKRINERVDQMIHDGLVAEVKDLYNKGYKECPSMKGIGYKEIIPYLESEMSLDDSIELLKRNSRRYAKRQYTWFKNKMDVNWYTVTPETYKNIFKTISYDLRGFLKEK